jgi:hypothetical protein
LPSVSASYLFGSRATYGQLERQRHAYLVRLSASEQNKVMNEAQRQAAQLAALGFGTAAIARRVGVSAKTVQRWKSLPGFRDETEREPDPSVRGALEEALTAVKRDGAPDHAIRIAAARALIALRPEAEGEQQPQPVLTIYKERAA